MALSSRQKRIQRVATALSTKGEVTLKVSDPSDKLEVQATRDVIRDAARTVGFGDTFTTTKRGSKIVGLANA